MNDDVHLKGSSVPLASSNIGQSGLRHGLNTNMRGSMVEKTSDSLKVAEDIPSLRDGLNAQLKYCALVEKLENQIDGEEHVCTCCSFFYIFIAPA